MTPDAIDVVNRQILAGQINNELGQQLSEPFEGLLVNAEQTVGFPIRDGVPDMVPGEYISLENFPTLQVATD